MYDSYRCMDRNDQMEVALRTKREQKKRRCLWVPCAQRTTWTTRKHPPISPLKSQQIGCPWCKVVNFIIFMHSIKHPPHPAPPHSCLILTSIILHLIPKPPIAHPPLPLWMDYYAFIIPQNVQVVPLLQVYHTHKRYSLKWYKVTTWA